MHTQFHTSIASIGKKIWSRLAPADNPFVSYEFLSALETNGRDEHAACCSETGWQPYHLAVSDSPSREPFAVMPLYLKGHSYGEYVFDWAWADAYQRNSLAYYPKLLSAIPFTPSVGPRLLTNSEQQGHATEALYSAVAQALKTTCAKDRLETAHVLFTTEQLTEQLSIQGFSVREAVQFHWFNKDQDGNPLQSFEGFLDGFKSRKRKSLLKERREIRRSNLDIVRLSGADLDKNIWKHFYNFYQSTYAKRSGHGGYLPLHFFETIGESMQSNILMVLALKDGIPVAAALDFIGGDTLYGRYWGCTEEAEYLHFELCYYQGIEYCIEKGLRRFDAGAQGEHKVQRGFVPVRTYSGHWVERENFRAAIESFIDREAKYNAAYIKSIQSHLPFKAQR